MRLRKLWALLGSLCESWRDRRRDGALLVAGADVVEGGHTVEVFRHRRGPELSLRAPLRVVRGDTPPTPAAGAGPSPTFQD